MWEEGRKSSHLDHRAWREVDSTGTTNDRTRDGGTRPPATLNNIRMVGKTNADLQILCSLFSVEVFTSLSGWKSLPLLYETCILIAETSPP
jgi:hypothetical protein